ncbi:MAG TPA: NYN domain-containing protein [Ilumatobacteraceae bacterium]|nr:NYN domain-containing protein [Ilumatobacteraceae bacterium]
MSADPVADVPDEALRLALEFAVGIAAVWSKMRPPQPFPPDLRRFLKFHKLPTAALAQVRSAVEADDAFRQRLGSVATTELVDEIGVLWLSRPDGWQQAIADASREEVADRETALRREERRRLAAQEAATRGRAELLSVRAELERERAAKAAIVQEGERLRADLEELRRRLRESQRAQHATAQALAKAEAELQAAGRQAAEFEPAPQDPQPTGLDVATVRKLIDGAVSASADIARMLNDALMEIEPAEAAGPPEVGAVARSGRARRKAPRLPGGVLAGTVEAAEFLIRAKGSTTLVDGYNVAKLGWPSLDLEQQRKQCLAAAENLAKRWNLAVTVVFDGAAIEGAHAAARRRVRVVYSPPGVSADDVLRAEVAAADSDTPVVVVTNDRAIIADVAAAGASTVSSGDFLALVR